MRQEVLGVIALLTTALILFSIHSSPNHQQQEYLAYLQKFNKPVPNGNEFTYRSKIFAKAVAEIELHNADPSQTYQMGINQFTDLTHEEFVSTYLGEFDDANVNFKPEEVNAGFNGDIDWRKQGIITSVKNQGQCGSCWAFAATAVHESYQIQTKHEPNTINLSEQQLVDCSGSYGNNGCNGGLASSGQKYIRDKGQTDQESYPYTAKTESCKINSGKWTISNVQMETGCSSLENRLQSGASAVRVDASNWSRYRTGVFSNCDTHTNHAVLCVGTN